MKNKEFFEGKKCNVYLTEVSEPGKEISDVVPDFFLFDFSKEQKDRFIPFQTPRLNHFIFFRFI